MVNPPKEVYFDHENSGWVPTEVVEAMLPFFNLKGYGVVLVLVGF